MPPMHPTSFPDAQPGGNVAQTLPATLWPALSETDSELQRRKKLAIRSGQLAMVVMLAGAVAGTLTAGFHKLSTQRLVALATTGFLYILWSLYSSRDAVRFSLWHHRAASPGASPFIAIPRSLLYIAVQFILGEIMTWLAGPARILGLLWLVLIPPIGHSVMFLPRLGIVLVSLLSIALHTFNTVWWHGTGLVPQALTAFSVAVLFAIVFTQIAVSAEKARCEVERLAAELSDANRKLREYALQAEELAATRERNRLAREIHDSLGHYLTVVHVQLEAARSTLERDPTHALDALTKAQSLTHTGLQEIRRSVAALRASPLHNRPLSEALRQVAAESQAAGLATEFQLLGQPRPLSPQAELTLYRTTQEGLTNCRKHAHTPSARVTLDFQQPQTVRLTVRDHGAGAQQTTGGFGLLGLRERAALLGGAVRIQTAPGQGFTLEVEVPA